MKASRITAVGLVAGAAIWIASGHLMPHDSGEGHAAIRPNETKQQPLFRVEVSPVKTVAHSPTLTLSGRTEAERKVAHDRAHRRHLDRVARQARPAR